jgi:hypothetical protein
VKVRYDTDCQDKSKVTILESQVMRITQASRNGGADPGVSRTLLRGIQHPCYRVHRQDAIAAPGQCYCATAATTSNFKNPFSSRNRKLVDPAQRNLQTLSINRALDPGLFINIPPLSDMRFKVRID